MFWRNLNFILMILGVAVAPCLWAAGQSDAPSDRPPDYQGFISVLNGDAGHSDLAQRIEAAEKLAQQIQSASTAEQQYLSWAAHNSAESAQLKIFVILEDYPYPDFNYYLTLLRHYWDPQHEKLRLAASQVMEAILDMAQFEDQLLGRLIYSEHREVKKKAEQLREIRSSKTVFRPVVNYLTGHDTDHRLKMVELVSTLVPPQAQATWEMLVKESEAAHFHHPWVMKMMDDFLVQHSPIMAETVFAAVRWARSLQNPIPRRGPPRNGEQPLDKIFPTTCPAIGQVILQTALKLYTYGEDSLPSLYTFLTDKTFGVPILLNKFAQVQLTSRAEWFSDGPEVENLVNFDDHVLARLMETLFRVQMTNYQLPMDRASVGCLKLLEGTGRIPRAIFSFTM
jgi:hypothetical protein